MQLGSQKASVELVSVDKYLEAVKAAEEETLGPTGGRGKRKLVETRRVQCHKTQGSESFTLWKIIDSIFAENIRTPPSSRYNFEKFISTIIL